MKISPGKNEHSNALVNILKPRSNWINLRESMLETQWHYITLLSLGYMCTRRGITVLKLVTEEVNVAICEHKMFDHKSKGLPSKSQF